jgi:hypothetical protein
MTTPAGAADVSYARWYVPLLIAFVISSFWLMAFTYRCNRDAKKINDLRRSADNYRRNVDGVTRTLESPYAAHQVLGWELELREVGIRRFAARTGRLPETLAECEADTPGLGQLYVWSMTMPPGHQVVQLVDAALAEPWWTGTGSGQPPAVLDCLGLPVFYKPDARTPPAEYAHSPWRLGGRAFSSEVNAYLEARGGIPAPPVAEFVLGSLLEREWGVAEARRRQAAEQQRRRLLDEAEALETRRERLTAVAWGGAGFILALFLVATCLWRGTAAAWKPVASAAAFAAALIPLVFLSRPGAEPDSVIMCYAPMEAKHYQTSQLLKGERMRILDEAVARGEITPGVAAVARQHIQALPK